MKSTILIGNGIGIIFLISLGNLFPAVHDSQLYCCLLYLFMVFSLVLVNVAVVSRFSRGKNIAYQLLIGLWLCYTTGSIIVSWLGLLQQLTLMNLAIILVLLQVLTAYLCPQSARTEHTSFVLRLPGRLVILSLLIIFMTLSQQTADLVRYHPIDADNMWYHFPMIAEMMRHSSIWNMDTIPVIARAYPGFREAFMTFLSLPMGNEHLAILGCLEWLQLAGVFMAILREFRVPWSITGAATAYLLTTPIVTRSGNGNDLCLAIQLMFTLWASIRYVKRSQMAEAVFLGLALGALATTKFSGAIYAAMSLSLLILHLFINRRAWVRPVHSWHLPAVLLCSLLVAGPWYIRNIVQYSNPLYPAQMGFGPFKLPGEYDATFFADKTLKWNLQPLIDNSWHFVEAFGFLIPLVAIIPVVFLVLAVSRFQHFRRLIVLLTMPVLLFVAFLHQPYNFPSFHFDFNMRYLIGWFTVSFILTLLAFLQVLRRDYLILVSLVLIALSLHNVYSWSAWYKWYLLAVGLVALIAWRMPWPIRFSFPVWTRTVVVAGMLASLAATYFVAQLREQNQYTTDYGYRDAPSSRGWGELARYVHRNVSMKKIVVTGDDRFFPFYGNQFTNAVTYSLSTDPVQLLMDCQRAKADLLVCLNPIKGRVGLAQYEHTPSIGKILTARYPGKFHVIHEAEGAYLLEVTVAD